MKLNVLLAALFVAGLATSIAIAKPPPGRGHGREAAPTAPASTAPAATLPSTGKVVLCHRAGRSTRWVRIKVSVKAARVRIAKGDVWLQDPSVACAAQPAGTTTDGTSTTDSTTTAVTTTAAATTTAATTTADTTTTATTTTATTTTTP